MSSPVPAARCGEMAGDGRRVGKSAGNRGQSWTRLIWRGCRSACSGHAPHAVEAFQFRRRMFRSASRLPCHHGLSASSSDSRGAAQFHGPIGITRRSSQRARDARNTRRVWLWLLPFLCGRRMISVRRQRLSGELDGGWNDSVQPGTNVWLANSAMKGSRRRPRPTA